mgnify:CR=1 FL=1|jgi:quercetin dioxygenase-like cupin family protein|tara:strand:+ start:1032 stop:1421 length:390 start_codon:yes stop_codon:yes gene_type:complete
MKIYHNGELLAVIIKFSDIDKDKDFVTENNEDFQVASFNLKGGESILNHYHPEQERKIFSTCEMITLIEGKIRINIFDLEQNLIKSEILTSGDSVALLRGGHGIEIIDNSKFIESKQGPYVEKSDKVRF